MEDRHPCGLGDASPFSGQLVQVEDCDATDYNAFEKPGLEVGLGRKKHLDLHPRFKIDNQRTTKGGFVVITGQPPRMDEHMTVRRDIGNMSGTETAPEFLRARLIKAENMIRHRPLPACRGKPLLECLGDGSVYDTRR